MKHSNNNLFTIGNKQGKLGINGASSWSLLAKDGFFFCQNESQTFMSQSNKAMPLISGSTQLFGCMAHPATHVRAPSLFNPIFAEQGTDAVMVPLDITPEGLADAVKGLHAMPQFKGAAVTIPHKMTLAALCDDLGPVARITGAVNAVRFENGRLKGDNFDGAGFLNGLIGEGHQLAGKSIVIIGAGGAARAVAYALSCEAIGSLHIYNRTTQKAQDLVNAVKTELPEAAIAVMDELDVSDCDIIVNATALGLKEGDALPCDLEPAKAEALICDIIMSPAETEWLKQAKNRGLACHYGRHMLDYQLSLIGQFIGATK